MKYPFLLRLSTLAGLSLLLLILTACESSAPDTGTVEPTASSEKQELNSTDRTYIPGNRIGLIDAQSTPKSIRAAYGKEALVDSLLWGAEGMRYPGFILFPGTDDALEVSFDDVAGVSTETSDEGSHWTAVGTGIRVGTSLGTLNRLNGRPFTFSGFGWDYEGNVMDWKGGKLEGYRLKLKYNYYDVDLAEGEYGQLMGDHELSSDLPLLKDLGVRVDALYFVSD